MPRPATNSAFARASGRRRTARSQRNTARSTTRVAAAVDLMASGSHFGIPHLDGVPGEYRLHAGEQASIRLARSLLEGEIAAPSDWRRVQRDPTAFVGLTLQRWIDLHGGKIIRRRFNLRLTLSEVVDEYAEAGEQDPDGRQLYFILHPDSAAYILAGPTLELLEREHARLPASFYHVFTGALNKWIRTYDYRDAEDRVDMLREWAEGEDEQYEIPDVGSSIPECMKRKALSLEGLKRLGRQARSSAVREVIGATLNLHQVSEEAKRPDLTDEIREQLADSNPPLPSALMVFAENDAIEGQFEDDSQNMMECLPEPNLIIPLNAFDPGSVQSAFATVAAVCETLEAGCRLIDLMPGNEKWVTDSEANHGSSGRGGG
jgi:hypothetical protein